MLQFDAKLDTVADPEGVLPEYESRGRILFRFWNIANEPYEIEMLDYDLDSSVLFLSQGLGVEYFLKHEIRLELELDGVYVMEGVYGECWESYLGGCDEVWHFDHIRRASPDEEECEMLLARSDRVEA
jgi:hypothetical protein